MTGQFVQQVHSSSLGPAGIRQRRKDSSPAGGIAAVQSETVAERALVSLKCGDHRSSKVTWSRENVTGHREDILTDEKGRKTKLIHDPHKHFGTESDSSLLIVRAVLRDSGKYFCNGVLVANLIVCE
ncbi:hypothetical protein GN956_G16558 [Arapaima gigas]